MIQNYEKSVKLTTKAELRLTKTLNMLEAARNSEQHERVPPLRDKALKALGALDNALDATNAEREKYWIDRGKECQQTFIEVAAPLLEETLGCYEAACNLAIPSDPLDLVRQLISALKLPYDLNSEAVSTAPIYLEILERADKELCHGDRARTHLSLFADKVTASKIP